MNKLYFGDCHDTSENSQPILVHKKDMYVDGLLLKKHNPVYVFRVHKELFN